MDFTFPNVNYALVEMPRYLKDTGLEEQTRNGRVRSFFNPVMLHTVLPMQRVILCPKRRANPFLFLLDGLSILSSVDFVRPFADITPRFREYSDDGVRLRGHYGKRLYPQIPIAIQMLLKDPTSRRVAMHIWNYGDLGVDSRDIPCNTMVTLRVVGGKLDLTVFNRSNDLMWGMLGANIVQFSFLQEYIAAEIGVPVGRLHQISTNCHLYLDFGPGRGDLAFTPPSGEYPPVISLHTNHLPHALNMLFLDLNDGVIPEFSSNSFVHEVVLPMLHVWKTGDLGHFNGLPDCDWFQAARIYLGRHG